MQSRSDRKGLFMWVLPRGRSGFGFHGEAIVAALIEALDAGKFDKAALSAAPGKHRDNADGLGDQCARHGDDGFLGKLFETPQCAKRRSRMNGADAARVTGAQAFKRSRASGPRTSPIGMRSGRKRSDERTRSESDATLSLVRSATRLGAWHCSSRVSSMRITRSEVLATSARSAFTSVVLPLDVPARNEDIAALLDRLP